MRYLKQLAIILAVTCAAEILKYLIPLPIPASIYGLVGMFALLAAKVIKLPDVQETASFLIEIMPLMFIPAAVGLIRSWEVLWPLLLPVAVIIVVTTFLVMAATGLTAQLLTRNKEVSDHE